MSVSSSRFRRLLYLAAGSLLLAVGAGLWGVPLPAQDPLRGEATARQLEELRAERDRLAREVEELRAKIAQRQAGWSQPGIQWDYSAMEVEVREGQSLKEVLREYFTKVDDALIERIRALNPGLDEDRLRVGQKIKLPTSSWSHETPFPKTAYTFDFGGQPWSLNRGGVLVHTVREGETIAGILRRYHGRSSDELLERVRELNPDLESNRLRPGQGIFLPVPSSSVAWIRAPYVQDPVAAEQPQLQETYLEQDDVEAARRAVADPFVQQPAGDRSVLAHEPVLDLVTRAVDLRGEVEIAIARLEEIERRGEPTRIAEVEVRTAERKLEVVLRLLQGERDAAAMELDIVRKQMKGLDKDDPRRLRLMVDAQRLELRIDTLQSAW